MFRRLAAGRGSGSVPGENWQPLVAASAVVWTLAFAIELALDVVSLPLVDRYLFGPLVVLGLFVAHFLLVLALALAADLDGTAVELAALVLWLPFGPFFAGCVYTDAVWRREHGREVGDSWYLYLVAGLVQGAAFWYLLRRTTKGTGTRLASGAADTEND